MKFTAIQNAPLKPFSVKHSFHDAFRWLHEYATGDCSILVDTPLGVLCYGFNSHVKPIFRSLYGPQDCAPDFDF